MLHGGGSCGSVSTEKYGRGNGRLSRMQSDGNQTPHLPIVRLAEVAPLLRPRRDVLYDYTIPEPGRRIMRQLEAHDLPAEGPYHGRVNGNPSRMRSARACLEALEAARLISTVYARTLDPLRADNGSQPLSREDVFERFARALVGERLLEASELLAADPSVLRMLDDYGTTIGTMAARWMQYLAHEAVRTSVVQRGFTAGRQLERLRMALIRIDASATVLDRYRALARRED